MRRLYEGERFWLGYTDNYRGEQLFYQMNPTNRYRYNQAVHWLEQNPTPEDAGFLEDEFLAQYCRVHVPYGRVAPNLWAEYSRMYLGVEYPKGFPFLYFNDADYSTVRLRTGPLLMQIPITSHSNNGYSIQWRKLGRNSVARNNGLYSVVSVPFHRNREVLDILREVERLTRALDIQGAVDNLTEVMKVFDGRSVLDFMEPDRERYNPEKIYTETPIWGQYQTQLAC